MTDLTTPREEELPEPLPLDLGEQEPAGRGTPVGDGVPLTRLLALARLSPAQALEAGAGVLAVASERPVGGAGIDEVLVDPVVTVEGRVTPAGARPGRPSAGRPVVTVLAEVAAAARHPAAGAAATAEPHLAQLDRAVDDLAGTSLSVVARRLQEAAAELDRDVVRAELAALARVVGELAGAAQAGRTAGAAARRAPTGAPRAQPVEASPGRKGSVARRIGAWLLSIVVLGSVVASEVVLLGDDITADIDLLLDAGRDGEDERAASAPEEPPPAPPEPAAAGNVAGVDLRPLELCVPGTPCAVRLLVRLVPSAEPQVVTWSYRVVDRCTGTGASAPGGTVTVPPHADRTAVVGVLPLPAVAAVVLTARTELPAVAASPPVTAGSCSATDPAG